MRKFNAKITELFDSLSSDEREELRWMLDYGFTEDVATELLRDGLAEAQATSPTSCPGLPITVTKSAKHDLDCFGNGQVRQQLTGVLSDLRAALENHRCQSLMGGLGWLCRDGPFRVVFRSIENNPAVLVLAIAAVGINPLQKVWRYFDQSKAEDLLKSSSLYFCRLDRLTGDPREARLPLVAARIRSQAFRNVFGNNAEETVVQTEEILRGTTYVCCWTRRNHESYLAWKHYCSAENGRPGGGMAIQSTWRQISHLHTRLRSTDEQVFCRAVGYLDPFCDDLPEHSEGEQVFWKSHWFSDETEVRLALLRTQSGSLDQIRHRIHNDLPTGEKIHCDLNLLVERAVLNPFASQDQKKHLQALVQEHHPALLGRISQSLI